MTYRKITETEFKQWSQQLEKICNSVLENIHIFPLLTVAKEKEDFVKIASLAIFHGEKGVLSAIFGGLLTLEAVGLRGDSCTDLLGGLTFEEWEKQILQRMKEHCIANGYYNPNSPSDLALLKTRRNKVDKALKDKNKLAKLLTYADSEDYRIITTTVNFREQIYKLMPGSEKDDDDIPKGIAFLVEDYVGRVEKLMNKLEQAEKSNRPSQPNLPSSPKPTEYKNNLEQEIQRLQDQVKELEEKINTTTDTTQKTAYQSILDTTKKDIEDKEREKNKLNNKQENPAKSNNSKVNLAIGLGIAAVLVGLIYLLLLINKRQER